MAKVQVVQIGANVRVIVWIGVVIVIVEHLRRRTLVASKIVVGVGVRTVRNVAVGVVVETELHGN